MLSLTRKGLYCKSGGFYIDPVAKVDCAVITHGHADHARWGMGQYIATPETCEIIRVRLGSEISISPINYHQPYQIGDVQITLIPAGHILGSAQIVVDDGKSRAIVTGDFKTDSDPTLETISYQTCDLLVMETTFALPIYHWPSIDDVFGSIHSF